MNTDVDGTSGQRCEEILFWIVSCISHYKKVIALSATFWLTLLDLVLRFLTWPLHRLRWRRGGEGRRGKHNSSFLFLQNTNKPLPASRPLHLLFPLPEMSHPQYFMGPAHSHLSGSCSSALFREALPDRSVHSGCLSGPPPHCIQLCSCHVYYLLTC